MKFYLFRHGQTDWNKEKRIQGSSNIPLNETGKSQARNLIAHLEAVEPEVIFSSDLDRALETARIVSDELDIPLFKEPRLREAHFGDAEGKTIDEIINEYGRELWENFKKMSLENKEVGFPGGETRWESVLRMRSVIDELIDKGEYQRIALSTHGGVVRNLLHSYLPPESRTIEIPNCVLYELESMRDGFKVRGPLN